MAKKGRRSRTTTLAAPTSPSQPPLEQDPADHNEEPVDDTPPPPPAPSAKRAIKFHEKPEPISIPAKSTSRSDQATESDFDSPPSRPHVPKSKSLTALVPESREIVISLPAVQTKKRRRVSRNVASGGKRTKEEIDGDGSKKQSFQRVWNDDDEIAVLNGMIEYSEKKGIDPLTNFDDFHDFIKGSLHSTYAKRQIFDKIRRLRNKFLDPRKKKTLTLHEEKTMGLGKKIWKISKHEVKTMEVGKKKWKNSKEEAASGCERWGMEADLNSAFIAEGLDASIVKDGWKLVGGRHKAELEERWKQLQIDDVEFCLKRNNLICEQAKFLLKVMKLGA